jgi:hypothetical protein
MLGAHAEAGRVLATGFVVAPSGCYFAAGAAVLSAFIAFL